MNMSNSPYEFNSDTRHFFVLSLERILETKIKNNKKIKYLFHTELENKLKNEKRKISLEFYKTKFGDNDLSFINILKQSGFSNATALKLPKFLDQNGSAKLINLCESKNYTEQLDKLFDGAHMEYSVIYMDLLLNFFAFHFQIRPDGKNEMLYYKLINQSQCIINMLNEYNNEFNQLIDKQIDTIIDALNVAEIEYQLNNHITLITDKVNQLLISMPEIIEYVPDKTNSEENEFFYKKYFQKTSLCSEKINKIIQYFKFIFNIIKTNRLEFLIEKIESKQKFFEYQFDICSDKAVERYENLIKRCQKALKKLKKANANSKKYKYIFQILNEQLPNSLEQHMFDFLKTLNYNFEQFMIFQGKYDNNMTGMSYFEKECEYNIKNNLFQFLSELNQMINSDNIYIIEFILITIIKYFYHIQTNEKMSFIDKINYYDNEKRTFSSACMFFGLIKNTILKISHLKKLDPKLHSLFVKYQHNYLEHISPFIKEKEFTKKQKNILELTSHLPKEIQQQAIHSEFLKLVMLDSKKGKKCKKGKKDKDDELKNWINFLLPSFKNNMIKNKMIKEKTTFKKNKFDKLDMEKHLNELLSSDNTIFEPIQSKNSNNDKDKDTYHKFLSMKEERDALQELINELELLDENPEEQEKQLNELDSQLEKLEVKFEFYQDINQEDEAAKNCVEINKNIERYRSLLTEFKEDEKENIDQIQDLERKIDECHNQMNYERVHFPTLDPRTGKIQGSNTTTYLPYEEPTFSHVQLSDQGYKLKKQVDTFKRETDKQDKRKQQITKFNNLLKQAELAIEDYINKLNQFFGLTNEDIDINITNFSKKIVYNIFDKYWFNSKYCIKSKIEMYFRMYVRNSMKSFHQGYSQIVLDLIKIVTSIQYLILLEKKIDLNKLIKTKKIEINKIQKNKIFLGKTFEIISGEDAGKQGIVFKENENNVTIKYQDVFIEESKLNVRHVMVNKDFIGKLVKPIVGSYKGRICMIIGERHDEFQLTVDTYGGSPSRLLSGITYITLKKGEFTVLPNNKQLSVDESITRIYKKIELTFQPENKNLYTSTRCLFDLFGFSLSYMIDYDDSHTHDERFNFLYGIGLVLYNKNKINDTEIYYSYVKLNNRFTDLQDKSKDCNRFDKISIRNSIMQIKKQMEKKKFTCQKNLIFKESDAWEHSSFQKLKLNKITDFLVFENTCSSTKEIMKKRKRTRVKKMKLNVSQVMKNTVSKMENVFNDL